MGKAIKKVAKVASPLTMGLLPSGAIDKVGDTLFGKKVEGSNTVLNPEDLAFKQKGQAAMTQGLDVLMNQQKDAGKDVGLDINRASTGITQSVEDQKRRAQEMTARRGLGGSSIGLGATLGIEKQGINQKQDLMANKDRMIRDAKSRSAMQLIGAANPLAATNIDRQITQAGRKGGIAPLLGAGIGAAFGGASGAKMGMGIGQAAQGAF